jgi:hypothetical protein
LLPLRRKTQEKGVSANPDVAEVQTKVPREPRAFDRKFPLQKEGEKGEGSQRTRDRR